LHISLLAIIEAIQLKWWC